MSYKQWLDQSSAGRRRLFHFTSSSHVIDNLSNGIIKVSDFSKCNDLFELASIELSDRSVRSRHRDWVSETAKTTGLVCFSRRWTGPLMWGHYANNGTGVCLVLDVVETHLQPVKYVKMRLAGNSNNSFPRANEPEFRSFCATKSSHWSYEREQRLFVDLSPENSEVVRKNELTFVKLGHSVELVGIVNGPNPNHGMKELLSAANRKIEYFQSRPAFRSFSIVVQQDQKLWKA